MRHNGANTPKFQDDHEGLRVLPLNRVECEKFQRYTAPWLSGARASAIMATVGELQRETNMARLAEMLAGQC
jgi:hypothetical protein